jgi:tetratricopeptide (TPR) repeat protein
MTGEHERAIELFDSVHPQLANDVSHWVNYGHALRAAGRRDEALEAYRKVLELEPGLGLAWWSIANFKDYRFSPAEIEMMQAQLVRDSLPDENRCHVEFALGAALETKGAFAESFEHYRHANALRRSRLNHDPDDAGEQLARAKALYTPEFFRARAGFGCKSANPIFIVGMPRGGSTLVEQILSSHSAVEGTAELPDIPIIVAELKALRERPGYPEILAALDAAALNARGEQYLESTRHQRKTDRPYFTDKTLLNFQHVGLIHLILPNARIIDVRRQAMFPHGLHAAQLRSLRDRAVLPDLCRDDGSLRPGSARQGASCFP